MKLRSFVFCLLVLAASPQAFAAGLADLAWIAGHWSRGSGETRTEEMWMAPAGGLMLGTGRTLTAKGTQFEFLRIEERNGEIAYVAQPGGAPPTRFAAKEVAKDRVVFENLAHDFPQRIIYWKKNEQLCARVEATVDKKVEGEEWCWSREK